MECVRKKIISASVYPALLILVAVGVILFLLSYLAPWRQTEASGTGAAQAMM